MSWDGPYRGQIYKNEGVRLSIVSAPEDDKRKFE